MDRQELITAIQDAGAARDLELAISGEWLRISAPADEATAGLSSEELLREHPLSGLGKYWRDFTGQTTRLVAQVPLEVLLATPALVNGLPGLAEALSPEAVGGTEVPADPLELATMALEEAGLTVISSTDTAVVGRADQLSWRAEVEMSVGDDELSVWCPLAGWPSADGAQGGDRVAAIWLLSLGRTVRLVAPALRDVEGSGQQELQCGWSLAAPLWGLSLPLAGHAAAAAAAGALRFNVEARAILQDASVAEALSRAYETAA